MTRIKGKITRPVAMWESKINADEAILEVSDLADRVSFFIEAAIELRGAFIGAGKMNETFLDLFFNLDHALPAIYDRLDKQEVL